MFAIAVAPSQPPQQLPNARPVAQVRAALCCTVQSTHARTCMVHGAWCMVLRASCFVHGGARLTRIIAFVRDSWRAAQTTTRTPTLAPSSRAWQWTLPPTRTPTRWNTTPPTVRTPTREARNTRQYVFIGLRLLRFDHASRDRNAAYCVLWIAPMLRLSCASSYTHGMCLTCRCCRSLVARAARRRNKLCRGARHLQLCRWCRAVWRKSSVVTIPFR